MRSTRLPHLALQRHSERYQNLWDRNRSSSRVVAMQARKVSQDQFNGVVHL